MIVDPSQSSLDLSTTLRDRGAEGALESSGEWAAEAWDVLKALAASGREFTTDDLVARIGTPPSPNATGTIVLNGIRSGLIRNVGWSSSGRVSAHRRRIGCYQGTGRSA